MFLAIGAWQIILIALFVLLPVFVLGYFVGLSKGRKENINNLKK